MLRFLYAYLLYTWGGMHRLFGNQNGVRHEHERAVHYFGRALEVDPSFRRVRLERGVLLYRELGLLPEALADFNALLDEDPVYADALLNRALLFQQNGRYADALADLDIYLQLPETYNSHHFREEATNIASLLRELLND